MHGFSINLYRMYFSSTRIREVILRYAVIIIMFAITRYMSAKVMYVIQTVLKHVVTYFTSAKVTFAE